MSPTSVDVTLLRANLASILDAASRGQVHEVTRHGRVIARIVPPDSGQGDDGDDGGGKGA